MTCESSNFDIKITCRKCGSKNIKISRNFDWIFDGYDDVCENTGNIDVECLMCGCAEIIYVDNE